MWYRIWNVWLYLTDIDLSAYKPGTLKARCLVPEWDFCSSHPALIVENGSTCWKTPPPCAPHDAYMLRMLWAGEACNSPVWELEPCTIGIPTSVEASVYTLPWLRHPHSMHACKKVTESHAIMEVDHVHGFPSHDLMNKVNLWERKMYKEPVWCIGSYVRFLCEIPDSNLPSFSHETHCMVDGKSSSLSMRVRD